MRSYVWALLLLSGAPLNCGKCGNVCAPPAMCVGGGCT